MPRKLPLRLLSALLGGLLLTALAAHAQQGPPDDEQALLEIPLGGQPFSGDLDGMLERRQIRALVVTNRTHYFVERGRQYGLSYESLKAFEAAVNKRHKSAAKHLRTHVVFIPVSRDQLLPALRDGYGDIAVAALTITPERQKQVDFATPMTSGIDEIAVTGPKSPPLVTVDDLSGNEVFVRKSSSYYEHLVALNRRFKAAGRAPVRLREAPETLEDEDLMEMVSAGLVGIVVVDDYKARLWAKILPDLVLHPEVAVNRDGQFAWMIRHGSPKLKAEIDAFAAKHRQGTLFGNTLIKRYTGSTRFIDTATGDADLQRFRRVVELFREYGDRYKVDHLLMMAQAYQESRLDHSVKSPAGAIGIMQIMPSTGAELGVGDIAKLENNVHGGVKYLRSLIDRYFADQPMSDLDKMLFGFAAYNAGPGRVRQLRGEATKQGLDPNRWFNQVERVAARKIGAETVNYVANIYKYYVAYRLLQQQQQEREQARRELREGR
ncbi:MAG TPA: transporter substrate-binding domain-containing protein [Gammaproteobacteria bacterium]